MMSYINETDFVIENKKLVYPEIVADGLQLYYDAKGKRDTDYHRDTMLDMSGNKNHGKLHNFAYEKHSGYKDGLVFDYIDDKLVRPTLDLQPDDFTFMLNGNIISFSPDGTVKRVQDGEVIESKGFNLIKNGDFSDGTSGWFPIITNRDSLLLENNRLKIISSNNDFDLGTYFTSPVLLANNKYYIRLKAESPNNNSEERFIIRKSYDNIFRDLMKEPINQSTHSVIVEKEQDSATTGYITLNGPKPEGQGYYYYIDYLMLINITEAFGAGNEPTKEQMDEIIDRFGFIPNAQDLIDRVEYKGNDLGDMENIIDGLYKTDILSGEEIYTDKADDAVVHVEVDGNSVGGGSGKNLVELDLLEQQSVLRVKYPLGKLKPGISYYVSFKNKDYTFWNGGGWVSEGPITDSIRSTGVVIRKGTGSAGAGEEYIVEELIKDGLFQIEEGSTSTAYEPPAPTPDYPIEIHSLNDFDVVSSVGRENIFQLSKFEDIPSSSSSIVSLIKDGFRLTNTYGYIIGFANPDLKPGKTYTISGEVIAKSGMGNGVEGRFIILTKDATRAQSVMLYRGGEGKFTSTFSTPADFNYNNYHALYAYGISTKADGIPGVVDFINIKIEEGQYQTPYALSSEEISENDNHPLIDKINLLLDEPLRSVGDVKDRLFRDSDGVWKIERNVGEYIINGTNAWTVGSPGSGWTTNGDTLPLYGALDYQRMGGAWSTNSITSRFPTHPSTSGIVRSNMESFSLGYATFGIIIRIKKSRLTQETSVGFVNWLKENPINVVYELKTSKVETLSQSLQDKLNNLRSFEDSNYVYTVLPNEDNYLTDNLKPTLHAKFLYNNWYKEDRVINNLMIYNRALTNEEMLQNYKTVKRRWGM